MVQRITISPQQYQTADQSIALRPDQVHYLLRVLRLKSGDRFIAQNGQGQQWLAVISDQASRAQVLEAIASPLSSLPSTSIPSIRLIAALPKGNGFDQVVRQTTELGVTHIHPVISDRTLLKPSANKLERWRRIAQEASEQSERLTVPEIYEPIAFQHCIKHPSWKDHSIDQSGSTNGQTLYCICYARCEISQSGADDKSSTTTASTDSLHLLAYLLRHQAQNSASKNLPSIVLAIGPEGGWTAEEITVAISNGYKTVSLGSAILRAVTAPIAALSLITASRELLI